MKVIKTIWIDVVIVFIAVYVYAVILTVFDKQVTRTFFQSAFAALFLVLVYGVMFWSTFVIALIIFDLALLNKTQDNLRQKLLIEWFVISCPFIYWTIRYNEWIFAVGVVAFLIGQMLREKRLKWTT